MEQVSAPESSPELSEIEAKLYASPQERDRCQAALKKAQEELQVVIYQLVRFLKDGKPAPMRKRDGNIYELRDLQKELGERARPQGTPEEQALAGRDVARFYYLMRSHDTTMDFDLDLATSQSDENPVFYVQYAHARICSVISKAAEAGLSPEGPDASRHLSDPKELSLLKKILELPDEVRRCAEDFGVHRLTTYAQELARTYHAFYDACRVIQPDQPELTSARLQLSLAAATALRSALALLGISAPERMVRNERPDENVETPE
jgi:arginyl-tRNA synthetase